MFLKDIQSEKVRPLNFSAGELGLVELSAQTEKMGRPNNSDSWIGRIIYNLDNTVLYSDEHAHSTAVQYVFT